METMESDEMWKAHEADFLMSRHFYDWSVKMTEGTTAWPELILKDRPPPRYDSVIHAAERT